MTDGEKIQLGATRWSGLLDEHGPAVHDAILDHMIRYLIERGYNPLPHVCAHMAGNVSQEQWDRVVAHAATQLKGRDPVFARLADPIDPGNSEA